MLEYDYNDGASGFHTLSFKQQQSGQNLINRAVPYTPLIGESETTTNKGNEMPIIEFTAERAASAYDPQVDAELKDLIAATASNLNSATQVTVPTVDADKFVSLFQTAANGKGFTARVRLRKDDGKVGKDTYTKGKRAGKPIPTGNTELIFSLTEKYAPGRGRKATETVTEPSAE